MVPFPLLVFVQSLRRVRLFATPWTAARQAPLSFTISWSLLTWISLTGLVPPSYRDGELTAPPSLAVTLTADGSCLNFEVMPLTTPSPNTHMLPTTEVWPSSFIVGAFL